MGKFTRSLRNPTAMKLLLLASLATLGLSAPQNSFFVLTRGSGARESTSYIDYSTGLRSSSSKVASPKVIRPTTDSALAYMKEYFGEDLCSAAAQAYLESILDGGDAAEANAAAAAAYKAASRAGATITPGSPCQAAKTSFVRNYNSGRDVVQEATLAFVNAWPERRKGTLAPPLARPSSPPTARTAPPPQPPKPSSTPPSLTPPPSTTRSVPPPPSPT